MQSALVGVDERRLRWDERDGVHGCDLSGHFWAQARYTEDGHWAYVVWDYQNNEMTSGEAESLPSAQDAFEAWDRWVVDSGEDPSRDWPEDDPR